MNVDTDSDNAFVNIACESLDDTLGFYTGSLGFRIEQIFPADAPRVALLSGHGITARLSVGDHEPDVTAATLSVCRIGESGFGVGRAGMEYRDLIPGRFDGAFIASHIRIPRGGPVPDYVHHHHVHFQMIYCINGWVTVAYEDQGEPMRLTPGDCFLQPPHIRHRVLESSDALEVVEFASPAEHPTFVDHEMALPTGRIEPDRLFDGQRFLFSRAADTPWTRDGNVATRDTGMSVATGGIASVVEIRPTESEKPLSLRHDGDIRFVFVLDGSASLDGEPERLSRHDSLALPGGTEQSLSGFSDDFRMLDVMLPSRPADQSAR